MKSNTEFDHLIGENNEELSEANLNIYKRIIKAHSAEQPIEDKRAIQHINLRLEMEDYISSESEDVKAAGSFLERLLKIYDIKKSQFAEFIHIEKTNFYALIKGKRKFNHVLAAKVGQIFNIDPTLWIFIEAKNEMRQTKHYLNNENYTLANLLNKK